MSGAPTDDTWVLVPARGGSKGIPRKNLRPVGGKPLILHVLTTLSNHLGRSRVVVSTEDQEIATLCEPYALIHHRSPELADDTTTLDEVAQEVASWLTERGARQEDILITVQPTSPFIKYATVAKGAALLRDGAGSVLSVKDDRHLRWTVAGNGQPLPLFTERVNRQQLQPTFTETGGLIGTRIGQLLASGTRINQPVALLEVDDVEALDIDTESELLLADLYARRLRVAIRADATPLLGMGHIYRALALTQALPEHDVRVVTRAGGEHQLGANFLRTHACRAWEIETEDDFFAVLASFKPDIVFLDVLDTTEDYVRRVAASGAVIVSLEDLGPGAQLADIVINDLYTDFYPHENHWYGVQHAILAPHFEAVAPRPEPASSVQNILITFGGTDPGNLTVKALRAIAELGEYGGVVSVVLGPGYSHPEPDLGRLRLRGKIMRSVSNMALTMREADLALTSAGRTVTELMTLGIPVLALCQNVRELRHTHASSPYGVINLGLGEHVSVTALSSHISMLITNHQLRADMRTRALAATRGRSNRAIAERILSAASSARLTEWTSRR